MDKSKILDYKVSGLKLGEYSIYVFSYTKKGNYNYLQLPFSILELFFYSISKVTAVANGISLGQVICKPSAVSFHFNFPL